MQVKIADSCISTCSTKFRISIIFINSIFSIFICFPYCSVENRWLHYWQNQIPHAFRDSSDIIISSTKRKIVDGTVFIIYSHRFKTVYCHKRIAVRKCRCKRISITATVDYFFNSQPSNIITVRFKHKIRVSSSWI